MLGALKDAAEKATVAVIEIVKDHWHPLFYTLVALGILFILEPWAILALGFGELGPIEDMSAVIHISETSSSGARRYANVLVFVGSFAAWWQSTYAGYVPEGSLFSLFQQLGSRLKIIMARGMHVLGEYQFMGKPIAALMKVRTICLAKVSFFVVSLRFARPRLGLRTVPYTDGYTVPSDGYGNRTVRTLCLTLTVRCTVRIYAVLTVKRRLSRPCMRLYSASM